MTSENKIDNKIQPSNVPYLVAVVVMILIATIGILFVTMLRPTQDNTSLIAIIGGFSASAIPAILAFMKSQETHLSVNSQLEKWMDAQAKLSRAEGEAAGVDKEQARMGAKMVPEGTSTVTAPALVVTDAPPPPEKKAP